MNNYECVTCWEKYYDKEKNTVYTEINQVSY